MNLKDFIQQAIEQITEGTVQSQIKVHKLGGEINPELGYTDELGKQGFIYSANGAVQVIYFDVALTVIEGTGTKGGINVLAGVVNLGSSGQSKNETSTVSRIKFSIPLRLPKHK